MSSSCRRTCGFNLDFAKSSSTSTLTSPTSSPSSTTTSETTNSPQSIIFRKKPRTLRKRPNQTFNEAATLLSTAHPNLFSTKNLKNPEKFTKPIITEYNDSSEPLLLFRDYENNDNDNDAFSFLLERKRSFQTEPNKAFFSVRENINKPCELSTKVVNCDKLDLESEEFDCESMLDEEIEEGIDGIMRGRTVQKDDTNCTECHIGLKQRSQSPLYHPSCHCGDGGKFGWVRTLRGVGEDDDTKWWNFCVVDMLQISPRMKHAAAEDLVPATTTTTTKKKAKNKKNKKDLVKELLPGEVAVSQGLLLKLNYDDVRNAWSDRGSPFADGSPGNDVTLSCSSLARDLKSKRKKDRSISSWMEGGVRKKSGLRYKEKKQIRHQFWVVNAHQRPRMKARLS
ncbi:Protein CHLOROPLAST IMPORT APPARATUS 2 [Glycine max]|nr:Protein CHLOROPLAST IMPORT APPARATUS 2 [Glycine max]